MMIGGVGHPVAAQTDPDPVFKTAGNKETPTIIVPNKTRFIEKNLLFRARF
jgi:hypothetical protein